MRKRTLLYLVAGVIALTGCGEVNTPTNARSTNESPQVPFSSHEVGENVTFWSFKDAWGRLCTSTPDALDCDFEGVPSQ
jgi:hypothetical protein